MTNQRKEVIPMQSPSDVPSEGGTVPAVLQISDIPESYRFAYMSGCNWCCDGGDCHGPYDAGTFEEKFFNMGWRRQDAEIKKHGRIL